MQCAETVARRQERRVESRLVGLFSEQQFANERAWRTAVAAAAGGLPSSPKMAVGLASMVAAVDFFAAAAAEAATCRKHTE